MTAKKSTEVKRAVRLAKRGMPVKDAAEKSGCHFSAIYRDKDYQDWRKSMKGEVK